MCNMLMTYIVNGNKKIKKYFWSHFCDKIKEAWLIYHPLIFLFQEIIKHQDFQSFLGGKGWSKGAGKQSSPLQARPPLVSGKLIPREDHLKESVAS